jgi:serine O-acetyltransferase
VSNSASLTSLAHPAESTQSWVRVLARDLGRYRRYRRNDGVLAIIITEQGLWALLQYRVASRLYQSRLSHLIKRPLLWLCVLWQKAVEITTGISLPYAARIGAGLYIGHFGNIIVGADAVIGEDCNLSQGVTVGVSGRGSHRGTPVIGDRVYLCANAVVSGQIRVGDDVVVGANSLVVRDVPEHVTVVGVPAEIASKHGSEDYIQAGLS